VCVESCPTEHFVFAVASSIEGSDWENKMICRYEVSVTNKTAAQEMIDNNICAGYYLKSKEGESTVCTFNVRSFHKLR
jgi:hypothetical protein